MYYYKFETIVGQLYILSNDEYLLAIQTKPPEEGKFFKNDIINLTMKQLDEYFKGERKDFELPTKIQGTDFEMRGYEAMINVPYGETMSYKQLSEAMKHPKSYRAVGSVCAKNPYPIIVPCHRILKTDNSLGGYAFGLDMKTKLLEIEGKNVINGKVL